MKAPDVIYLAESDKVKGEVSSNFASENPFKTHTSIAYIRKNALLEWANKELKDNVGQYHNDYDLALSSLIDKLNSM